MRQKMYVLRLYSIFTSWTTTSYLFPSNSAEAPAREEHEPTCQGKCHGASASEIYKSDWFDKQLDRDLAELDALDAFEELQKEFEEVREETDDLGPALSKKWNFHYGWFSVKPFRGSDSEYDIGSRVRRLDSLMDRLKNLLETLPAGGYEWKETLEMIIWGAGASSFWNQFSVVLAEEPEE